jgi:AcrR family transcriptional regulator
MASSAPFPALSQSEGRQALIPVLAEVFRLHGYAGASLSQITKATGMGKGSLYHHFPGGKADMMAAVLAHISHWFEQAMFTPLESLPPAQGIAAMFTASDDYFRSGQRVCLIGAAALDQTRDTFGAEISAYFGRWVTCLTTCLERGGCPDQDARSVARDVVLSIQGALTLSQALGDPQVFSEALSRLRQRCNAVLGP